MRPAGSAPAIAFLHPRRLHIQVAAALVHPRAVDPDVAVAAPVPVARRPEVARPRRGHDLDARRRGRPDANDDLREHRRQRTRERARTARTRARQRPRERGDDEAGPRYTGHEPRGDQPRQRRRDRRERRRGRGHEGGRGHRARRRPAPHGERQRQHGDVEADRERRRQHRQQRRRRVGAIERRAVDDEAHLERERGQQRHREEHGFRRLLRNDGCVDIWRDDGGGRLVDRNVTAMREGPLDGDQSTRHQRQRDARQHERNARIDAAQLQQGTARTRWRRRGQASTGR